jgi:ParB/RepB/Spo0J family partition protein
MEARSFKQMIQAGEIKRADAMKVRLDDIHEEVGFNLRIEGEDLERSIDALADHIMAGGVYPALEVRPNPMGGVLVVDGHRRRRALLKARDAGAPIEWVEVRAFTGNDADRVARVITSAEGRNLSPLEVAMGYKRLAAFGLTAEEIAAKVGKTRQHVDQLLILANSNTDVQKLVAAGGVSAAVAVKVARKEGENAGKVLGEELAKAKAAGKGKVTAGTMAPKPLPPKVTMGLVDEVEAFTKEISTEQRALLWDIKEGKRPSKPVTIDGAALASLLDEFAKVVEARAKQAEKQRAKAAKVAQGELV